MKKIIFTLVIVSSSLINTQLSAQACGNSGPSVCVPSGQFIGGGFENPDSIHCVVQGVAYTHAIQFTMFSSFVFPGVGTVTVDSVQFTSISNLPCGLCWATTNVNNRFVADESGCINITGTSSDPAGQYKLSLTLNAWINGSSMVVPVPATLVDQTPVKILIRVKAPAGVCAAADTSSGANNLTASTSCPNSINSLEADFASLQLVPNPMNGNGVLSFVSEKSRAYTVRVSDMTGKIVSSKEVEIKRGINSIPIERNNLPVGVYFISVTDGQNAATTRFSVTE